MKEFFIQQLLAKYKPRLVTVFGRHGREEARDAISIVLGKHSPSFSSSADRFFDNLYKHLGGFAGVLTAFLTERSFPHFCVIDTHPDSDIYAKLMDVMGLDLAVIVAVGDIPSYTEVFAGAQKYSEKVARESRKARHIIYTYDDETIRGLISAVPVSMRSYGFDQGADIRIDSAQDWIYIKQKTSGGITLKAEYEGSLVPFNILNCYGKKNIYASCTALAAARFYEINFISASQDIKEYISPPHSLRLRNGIKSTALITHYKNVTPLSAREAIEIVGNMREEGDADRVIIILADVLLRVHEEAESLHRVLGEMVAHNADEVILIGERVIFTEKEALTHNMRKEGISRHATAKEAMRDIIDTIREHDVILVLGSKEMGLKEIIDEIIER
ncbi:MAG: hypothetical protein R3251_03640 [Candidatus Spechtbacterales bacterium]|nr:hypothetical protein [Candidatus Spechtbacterales bacterium]